MKRGEFIVVMGVKHTQAGLAGLVAMVQVGTCRVDNNNNIPGMKCGQSTYSICPEC